MQFLKRSKKYHPSSQPLASGIPSHIGDVVPPGISAEQDPDIGSECTLRSVRSCRRLFDLTTVAGLNDGGGSQVALRDSRDGRSYESGASTSTAGQDEAPIFMTATHQRERKQEVPPKVLDQQSSYDVPDLSSPERESEALNLRQNPRGFGSLKAVLETLSGVYAHREVCLP